MAFLCPSVWKYFDILILLYEYTNSIENSKHWKKPVIVVDVYLYVHVFTFREFTHVSEKQRLSCVYIFFLVNYIVYIVSTKHIS